MIEPPRGYEFQNVWQATTEQLREAVVPFWLAEGALSDEMRARHRANELIAVARSDQGVLAAVSTARKVFVHQLELPCFFYRMFVGKTHRSRGLRSTDLVRRLFVYSFHVLNDRFQAGHDRDCAGMYMEVENASLKRSRNQTVWTDFGSNVVYLGKTPRGAHARIWYFPGSTLQP